MVQKKYKTYGMGWYNESQRHSLARQGVKTGRKNYAAITASGVTYEPIGIGTEVPKELKEEPIMPDVDKIVAESKEERMVSPEEVRITVPEEKVEVPEKILKEETQLSKDIETDLSSLEAEHEPLNVLQKKWGEKISDRIKEYLKSGIQAYRDTNVSGIEKHIGNLEEEKVSLQDRVNLLTMLKTKVMSKEYRDDVGVSKQLGQVNRINKLMSKPQGHLRVIDNTISKLQKRKEILTRPKAPRRPGEPGEPAKGIRGAYVSIFPTFGEIMHPERLKK